VLSSLERLSEGNTTSNKREKERMALPIDDLSHFQSWIVDMGNATTLNVDLGGGPIEKARQVWLLGFYVRDNNTEDMAVRLEAPGFNITQPVLNNTAVPNTALLIAPVLAAGQRIDLSKPIALWGPDNNANRFCRIRVSVTNWIGAPVTYGRLVLIFAVQNQDARMDPWQAYHWGVPMRGIQNQAMNQF
jgi:hypothetical protein